MHPELGKRWRHMLQEDRTLYKMFLEKYPEFPGEYDYDVLVGDGIKPDPKLFSQELITMTLALTKKRIDVVIKQTQEIWIVEVKPRASLSAIGQVLCYVELYRSTFRDEKRDIRPMIITDRAGEDERFLFKKFHVLVWYVG